VFEHLQPRKLRVGVLDFGDGRPFLQAPLEPVNRRFRQQLVGRLEADGVEVVEGDEVIWQNDIAVRNGRHMFTPSSNRPPSARAPSSSRSPIKACPSR
jgi:hypothetical protein